MGSYTNLGRKKDLTFQWVTEESLIKKKNTIYKMWEASGHKSAWQLAITALGLNRGGRKALLDTIEENSQTGGGVAISREI